MDTVGPPLKNTQVRVGDDGEILVKGELVMTGYWRNPAVTERTVVDGWLHTGDVGHLDEVGRIVITDRKKDLINNDKGDNVAPQKVEGMLTLQPEIVQAMVVGDKRPYLVGLIVPDCDWTAEWAVANGKRLDFAELGRDPEYLRRSEEHTSELQSLMRISYAVFCLKKKKHTNIDEHRRQNINEYTTHITL